MTAPRITAIVFDIGDTLVHAAPSGTSVSDLVVDPIGTAVADLQALSGIYRLGAVTDTSVMTEADVRALLGPCGLDALLEVVVTSVDVGAAKPDPRGLQLAMRLLEVEPGATLFVGDADVDAGAASTAGTHFARTDGRSPGLVVAEFLDRRSPEAVPD